MYRNVFYNPIKEEVFLRTWTEDGKRIDINQSFYPYLFLEQEGAKDAISIFKTPLVKKTFSTTSQRKQFIEQVGTPRIFFNLPPEQQFLIDTFKGHNNKKNFSQWPLKIFFFDIETFSPNSFPVPDDARDSINLITLYDSLSKKFYTWGLEKSYISKQENCVYFQCKNESDLLVSFLKFWRQDYPDCVVGWNSDAFDIPYLINRIEKILGENYKKELSPVKHLYSYKVFNQFGNQITRWSIGGISCLDYMDIYRVFSIGERESYSLNYIAELELNETKVSFNSTSLSKLSQTDWDTFVDYNIQDVNLLVKLEKKLKYLEIVRLLSYKGCTNFEKAVGKISILTGAIALKALEQNYIIPTFLPQIENRPPYAGGFVKEPEKGLHKAIVTFDANSLYPNTIITLNISPETKIGKIIDHDNPLNNYLNDKQPSNNNKEVTIKLLNKQEYKISLDTLRNLLKERKLSLSKAGVLYTQNTKGIIPQFIDGLYQERVKAKEQMLELKKRKNKDPQTLSSIEYLDILQYTLKILLNSVYGITANVHSPFFDIDHASSITMTGQAVAKAGAHILEETIKQTYEVNPPCIVIAQDTDSIMITIDCVLSKHNISLTNQNNEITKEAYKIIDHLSSIVNQHIIKWAEKELNTIDCRYIFKREAIADVGIFLQKKHYILHVLDYEGVVGEKYKYVGVEVVKSTTPNEVKKLVKNIIDVAMRTQNYQKTNEAYFEAYEKFCKLKPDDIALRSSVMFDQKYTQGADLLKFPKGTPSHVKAALVYNFLIDQHNLESIREKIQSGQKIKYFLAEKNKYNIERLAYQGSFPEEFKIYPDYDKMFERTVSSAVKRIYETIGWQLPSIKLQAQTNLFDLLGVN